MLELAKSNSTAHGLGNMKAAIVILVILSLALGGGLIYRHQNAVTAQQQARQEIESLRNSLQVATNKLAEQRNVNAALETNLNQLETELNHQTDKSQTLSQKLAQTRAEAEEAAQKAQKELEQRDQRIAKLESERDALSGRMSQLNSDISDLENEIAVTEQKLAAAEGDREYLLKELKRLQAEKAELERQFNDLAVLRQQVQKLRDQLAISRRLDWIRRGLFGSTELKGAERLKQDFGDETASAEQFGLEVELEQDGKVRVQSSQASGSNPSETED